MAISINTNIMSMTAQRSLNSTQNGLATSMERLSSGLRVNSARDDSAGLAISERMGAQVRGLTVAIRNAADAISLSQTAEGALGEVGNSMQRMRELAVQAANATNGTADLANLDAEYQQLGAEVLRVLAATEFNGTAIVGAGAGANVFQVGADNNANQQITVTTTNMVTNAAVVAATGGSLTSTANAQAAIGLLDTSIDTVTTERATYGATQNRFQSVINSLEIARESQASARGRIVDADFAMETANLTRYQILQQAGTAMLAQANSAPQSVLQLLQ